MLRLNQVLICLSFLLVLACTRDEAVIQPNDNPQLESAEPLSQNQIDEFIISQMNEKNEVFRWSWASDQLVWSAAVQSDSVLAIGYQPTGFENFRERIHEFNLDAEAWNDARQQIVDYVLETTNRLHPEANYSLEDLLAFPENPNLPILNLRISDEIIVNALRNMEEVRYVEPIGYVLQETRERSGAGCDISPASNISGDFTTVSPGSKVPWNFYNMNIPSAWNTSQGDNITVAVIDTGSDDDQQNLVGSDFTSGWSGGRFIDRASTLVTGWWWWTSNDGPNDQCGHGTQMAGLAVAPRDNDGNSIGVAYKANLLAIRAVSDVVILGSSETNGVRDAITMAANRSDVKIMSMSIGTIFWSNSIADAVYYAHYSRGKMLFSAAGTSTWFTSWVGVIFPATMAETVAVTGIKEGTPLVKCNTCHSGNAVDFVAVMQRRNDNSRTSLTLAESGDQPARVGGSSAATATTAGIAALVWATNPNMSRSTVLQKLKNAASIYPGRDNNFGWGIIDASAAVN